MDTIQTKHIFSDKLAWGLTLVAIGLLLEALLAAYSLSNLGVQIDTETLSAAATQSNPVQTVLGCLSPIGGLLKLVGVFFLFSDSKRLGGLTAGHSKLAVTGLTMYMLSIVFLVVTLVLGVMSSLQGTLNSAILAVWTQTATQVLGFAGLLLLVYAFSPTNARIALLVGFGLLVIGSVVTSAMSASSFSLQTFETPTGTFFIPTSSLDRTQGIYPLMSGAGMLGVALYLLVYAAEAIWGWRVLSNEIPETVS